MSDNAPQVVSVGEVMVELSRGKNGRFSLAYGGDTFNTAVYLARNGVSVAYATALGDDRYSDGIVELAKAEGIATTSMLRVKDRLPGLYLIETDKSGERTFHYWRETAPARELFELADWSVVAERLLTAKLIYFSGVTLSIYNNTGIGRFLAVLELARAQGVKVAFDTNYRPRNWRGDVARARTVYGEAFKRVDIALPSFDDEAAMWGDASPEAAVERLQAFGIPEIVVKNAQNPALVVANGTREFVPITQAVKPVDTTAAGDSFSAGYLAARLSGSEAVPAVHAAHALAGHVVQHRGAIVPRAQSVH
ncbi:MAG: sugar kinase [Rhizobiales bacterium]|nr:sugar kinase [Hyphomicrobiales bacterium]